MSYFEPHPVLGEIKAERRRQDAKWGEQNHVDGTSAKLAFLAERARARVEDLRDEGRLSWRAILEEELWEAYCETDTAKLRAELIQSGAVIVAWVEAIDRRAAREVEQQ